MQLRNQNLEVYEGLQWWTDAERREVDGCAGVEEQWRKGRKRSKQDLGSFVADEEGAECGWRDDNPEGEVALEQMSSRAKNEH
jgi:hypothetical protein